ncbi:hypothetical protein LHYA1_G002891 [Lachnellula hyalina]|uniref:Uncharacterized protein n=1 Tax=Lachnellula hyalina TaxID=1316788 RepID=A0A8H8R7N8_9HELO|nr:uncharacterized protein LHYA1_G002891 [Lachnellula hyalina]TVY29210.1 hypothetical protein LHYA1_G002891 [Lachnellula hyalina]
MYAFRLNIVLGTLLPLAAPELSPRGLNDPAIAYLDQMCQPNVYNADHNSSGPIDILSAVENSPFPCEQSIHILAICSANGTSEIDFLAEQQCLCTGSFWEAQETCDACFSVHGLHIYSPEEVASNRSSLKTAECSPTPPFQPYSDLLRTVDIASVRLAPNITLTNDKFPNNTAVSNYYTLTSSFTPGTITGSATARLTSWDGVLYTPTSVPPNHGTGTTGSESSSAAITSSRSTAAVSSSGSQSSNGAPRQDVKVAGGLLAGLLGVAAML